MSSRPWISLIAVLVVCLAAGTAAAQVCGDADGSGTVTVTDGVLVLRQAAGLSSSCTLATCDVNGDGTVTVTDGVNVLRAVAGLASTVSCSSRDDQVQTLLRESLPNFGIFGALTKAGTASASTRAAAVQTQPCDNAEGSIAFDPDTGEIDFFNCDDFTGGVNSNGFLVIGSTTLDFDITITEIATGLFERLAGSLGFATDGNVLVLSGLFALDSSFGGFQVGFDQLVTDADGNLLGGSLAFTINNNALPDVQAVQLSFDGTTNVRVDVGLVSGEVLPFTYDLTTEVLTPIS